VGTGIAQYLGSVVATFASVPSDVKDPVKTLTLYTNLFFWLGVVAVGGAVVAVILLPLMAKLSREHSEGAMDRIRDGAPRTVGAEG
jgi:POT family proton-dependent oligopeptide transporter